MTDDQKGWCRSYASQVDIEDSRRNHITFGPFYRDSKAKDSTLPWMCCTINNIFETSEVRFEVNKSPYSKAQNFAQDSERKPPNSI